MITRSRVIFTADAKHPGAEFAESRIGGNLLSEISRIGQVFDAAGPHPLNNVPCDLLKAKVSPRPP